MSDDGRLVSLSMQGAAVFITAFEKTNVTLGTMILKAGIAEKIDFSIKGPLVQSWDLSDPDNPVSAVVVPETGAGFEQYRITKGGLTLSMAEAQHVRENFDSIMNDKGFPAKMSRGVLELNTALTAWGATVKEE